MARRSLTCCSSFHLNIENPHERNSDNDLLNVAIEGDWKTVEKILKNNPECVTHTLTPRGETLLHIAAMGKSKHFLRKLVSMLDKSELERQNHLGYTAFYLAVLSGVVENAKAIIEKNEEVSTILCCDCNPVHADCSPINAAAWNGHKKMVTYLLNTIPFEKLREKDRVDLLEATIQNNMYDVASKILDKDKSLATTQLRGNRTLLHLLAQKPLLLQVGYEFKRILFGLFLPAILTIVFIIIFSQALLFVCLAIVFIFVLPLLPMPYEIKRRLVGLLLPTSCVIVIGILCAFTFKIFIAFILLGFSANYLPLLKDIIIFNKVLAGRLLEKIWKEYLELPEERFSEIMKETEPLHYAAKEGNAEFLHMILNSRPNLVWVLNNDGQNIFHVAVLHHRRAVLNLIYRYRRSFKDFISAQVDKDGNTILHLAAKLTSTKKTSSNANHPQQQPPPRDPSSSKTSTNLKTYGHKEGDKDTPKSLLKVPGSALRLQREILWFKEVGKIVSPPQHKSQNKENKTAKQIFQEDHMESLKEGEIWMKNIASSCMIVAALITTVVFAAAFTVPGGNNNDTGIPVLVKRNNFTVYMVSDAVAVMCSSISIIMFLSILISSYRQDDFLVSLPSKLMVGLTTLFVSIVAMLVAFVMALSLTLDKPWKPRPIIATVVAPFALFLLLNFSIWLDTTISIVLVLKIRLVSYFKYYFG